MNIVFGCDAYKISHFQQYPEGTSRVYSNWTPRSSRVSGQNEVVFFGLQYFLQKYLQDEFRKNFFDRGRGEVEREYTRRLDGFFGPNNIGTKHIGALHELNYIPLEFHALPEGTLCPLRVPMFTMENTIDEFFWVTNYIETLLSTTIWMPCTSATLSYRLRCLMNEACEMTGGDPNFVSWQAHDFSMRGMASLEASAASGAGHLLSFTGTDTLPAIDFIEEYYPGENGLIGGSVPASEHSVACANTYMNNGIPEEDMYVKHMLDTYPSGIFSLVSDTYDLWKLITETIPKFKDRIMSRDGKTVLRPDSGDPVNIICGDPNGKTEHARKGVVQLLWEIFGGTINSKGYKQLDQHIGVIYGDAITYDRAKEIFARLAASGFASTNVVLGIGSFTFQLNTRDTFGFAVKATHAVINGEHRDLFKKPITDDGVKNSATGRLSVVRQDGLLKVIEKATPEQMQQSLLRKVWSNGLFIQDRYQTFKQVRRTLGVFQ